MLDYLRRHHVRLPRPVSVDDARDALVLAAWIHWQERRREAELLRRARSYGYSLRELGAFLGLASRQATYDHLDRLDALVEAHTADQPRQARAASERVAAQRAVDGHDRDPDLIAGPQGTATLPAAADLYRRTRGRRASRAGADPETVRARRRERRARPAREHWIDAQHDELDALVSELLTQTDRLGIETREQDSEELELGDTLAAIARHRDANQYSPATMGALGLALGELRTHPAVEALARNHGIHQAIATADRIRARYSALI